MVIVLLLLLIALHIYSNWKDHYKDVSDIITSKVKKSYKDNNVKMKSKDAIRKAKKEFNSLLKNKTGK